MARLGAVDVGEPTTGARQAPVVGRTEEVLEGRALAELPGMPPAGAAESALARHRLGPRGVVVLQRLAGNAAVAALLEPAPSPARVLQRCGIAPCECPDGETAPAPRPSPLDGHRIVQRQLTGSSHPPWPAPPRAPLVVQRRPLLSDAGVVRAISYYRLQPERYTREIMLEIQGLLSVTPTGRADPETVEGIAARQAGDATEPRLKIDGKAGPRTLPRLFPEGLNLAGEVAAYNVDIEGVVDGAAWATMSAGQRRERLGDVINARLEAANVPPMRMVPSGPEFRSRAQFDPGTWTFTVRDNILGDPQLDRSEADALAGTVYHEGRHAQQVFRMAQFRAQRGDSKETIAALWPIDLAVAALAVERKDELTPMQGVIASHWVESTTGPGLAAYNRVKDRAVCAVVAHRCARNRAAADPDDPELQTRLEAARRRREVEEARYRDLPVENDAYATANLLHRAESDDDPDACSKLCPTSGSPAAAGR